MKRSQLGGEQKTRRGRVERSTNGGVVGRGRRDRMEESSRRELRRREAKGGGRGKKKNGRERD